MLILTETVFRLPGVTMKSSYPKLVSKAARVTRVEHTQFLLVNNVLVATRKIESVY